MEYRNISLGAGAAEIQIASIYPQQHETSACGSRGPTKIPEEYRNISSGGGRCSSRDGTIGKPDMGFSRDRFVVGCYYHHPTGTNPCWIPWSWLDRIPRVAEPGE